MFDRLYWEEAYAVNSIFQNTSSACENPVCVTQFWMRKMEWKCKTWFCVTITTILAFFLALLFVVTTSSSSREKWPTCVLQGIQRRLLLLPVDYKQQSEKTRLFFHSRDISRNEVKKSKDQMNQRKNVWKIQEKNTFHILNTVQYKNGY